MKWTACSDWKNGKNACIQRSALDLNIYHGLQMVWNQCVNKSHLSNICTSFSIFHIIKYLSNSPERILSDYYWFICFARQHLKKLPSFPQQVISNATILLFQSMYLHKQLLAKMQPINYFLTTFRLLQKSYVLITWYGIFLWREISLARVTCTGTLHLCHTNTLSKHYEHFSVSPLLLGTYYMIPWLPAVVSKFKKNLHMWNQQQSLAQMCTPPKWISAFF